MPALVQSARSLPFAVTGSELTLTGKEGDMYMDSIVLHALESPLLECLSLKTIRGVLKLLGIAKAKKPFKCSKKGGIIRPSFKGELSPKIKCG